VIDFSSYTGGDAVHAEFMSEAIRLAAEGVSRGDGGPFGAVVVHGGRIIGRGWNRVVTDRDPTAHGEINAIREACATLRDFRLSGSELYTTCEPCPMCLAAAYWARIERVWFAATREDAAAIGFDDSLIHDNLRRPSGGGHLCRGPVLRDQALAVFRAWRASPLRVTY
jgi:tRNA(Arg) A34 adenosine deaminase TadA